MILVDTLLPIYKILKLVTFTQFFKNVSLKKCKVAFLVYGLNISIDSYNETKHQITTYSN